MIDKLFNHLAPHYCCSCGEIGEVLCSNCKYDIVETSFEICLNCGNLAGFSGICMACNVPYDQAWCVGWRQDVLRKLIDDFKFERQRAAGLALAELLDIRLPVLEDVTVVSIPTIVPHVRQRGYDHAAIIAKEFARLRNLPYEKCLLRRDASRQRGASRKQRIQQAKRAFKARSVDTGSTYLLIDDVVTTGSTIYYGAQTLIDAGASRVYVAAIARQPSTEAD